MPRVADDCTEQQLGVNAQVLAQHDSMYFELLLGNEKPWQQRFPRTIYSGYHRFSVLLELGIFVRKT